MDENILGRVLEVFSQMSEWLGTAVVDILPMFYTAEAGLTIIGVMTVAGLSLSVTFLIIGVISNFLHFRG